MGEYKAVRSSHEISISIADFLEASTPQIYGGGRVHAIRKINDILQGRSVETIDALADTLMEIGGAQYPERLERICGDIRAFQAQKDLLTTPYTKSSTKNYQYRLWGPDSLRTLKIINQRLFDLAAKAGFPPGFFRESYFDHVTIYCLPDHSDLNFSRFSDCTFAVCRIREACFDGASFNRSIFHTVDMRQTTFFMPCLPIRISMTAHWS